jgi:hypothetical protein
LNKRVISLNNPPCKDYYVSFELHYHNDAFIIAGGTFQQRVEPLMIEQIRHHKRSMEQFYDAKYIDKFSGEKTSGSTLNSGKQSS